MDKFTKFIVLMVAMGSILALMGCDSSYRYPVYNPSYPAYNPYYYHSYDLYDSISELYETCDH